MLPGRVRVLTVAVGEDHTHHWADDDDRGSTSSAGALLAADERRTTRTAHQMGPQRRYTRRSAGFCLSVCTRMCGCVHGTLFAHCSPSVCPTELVMPSSHHTTRHDYTVLSVSCLAWRCNLCCVESAIKPEPTNQPAWFETLLVFDKSFPP